MNLRYHERARVKGRYAKQRGTRFELAVRDSLRKLYPPERRRAIQRVPLSGAGVFKGDVIDMNDPNWCYEAKNCEKLALPDWWRQTKAQAQSFQTPCLIFTSNHRPVYWCLRERDLLSYASLTTYKGRLDAAKGTTRGLFDKLEGLPNLAYWLAEVDGDDLAIVPEKLYLSIRKEILDGGEA